jgi:hypothetical protein
MPFKRTHCTKSLHFSFFFVAAGSARKALSVLSVSFLSFPKMMSVFPELLPLNEQKSRAAQIRTGRRARGSPESICICMTRQFQGQEPAGVSDISDSPYMFLSGTGLPMAFF